MSVYREMNKMDFYLYFMNKDISLVIQTFYE